jgi:hypothetical protein
VIGFWLLLVCAIGMVVAQDAFPALPVYHYGWYNAIDVALVILAALQLRGRVNAGFLIAAFGAAVVVFTGIASGLMGPDTVTIVGAPGASVRSDDAGGFFVFPLAQSNAPIVLQRGNSAVSIGTRPRYTGGFVMWQQPRPVVYVDVADPKGNHLTITQPTNASFLSPVLLMQLSTTIAGMNVHYDTFSVPALRRNVKAVLFTEQQAAQLRANPPIVGRAAVLFDVADSSDRSLPNGLGLIASGERKLIGGVLLRATVGTYPAVVVASAPYLPVLVLGLTCVVVGAVIATRRTQQAT